LVQVDSNLFEGITGVFCLLFCAKYIAESEQSMSSIPAVPHISANTSITHDPPIFTFRLPPLMVSGTVFVKESEQTFRGTFYICSINKTRDSIQQPDFDVLSQLVLLTLHDFFTADVHDLHFHIGVLITAFVAPRQECHNACGTGGLDHTEEKQQDN